MELDYKGYKIKFDDFDCNIGAFKGKDSLCALIIKAESKGFESKYRFDFFIKDYDEYVNDFNKLGSKVCEEAIGEVKKIINKDIELGKQREKYFYSLEWDWTLKEFKDKQFYASPQS